MRPDVVPLLRCPDRCRAPLTLDAFVTDGDDVTFGRLECPTCGQGYPILAGVAVVVPRPSAYLTAHAAGVRATVDWGLLTRAQRLALLGPAEPGSRDPAPTLERAKVEYIARHYLRADASGPRWWEPSPLGPLMLEAWNRDPMTLAAQALAARAPLGGLLDLGTNVGGLACAASRWCDRVIGMDLSLVVTHWGRNYLRGRAALEVELPGDRLRAVAGPRVELPPPPEPRGLIELIVADACAPPVEDGAWDAAASLNLIDLLDRPEQLPQVQRRLLRPGGFVLSASPYSFSEQSSVGLRPLGPTSVSAVDAAYRAAGFAVAERDEQVPWLFFKHPRQLELYSAHYSVYQLTAGS